jgi:hypothetical protein
LVLLPPTGSTTSEIRNPGQNSNIKAKISIAKKDCRETTGGLGEKADYFSAVVL